LPGKARFCLADIPVHIVQGGYNVEPVLFDVSDYLACLDWLAEAVEHHECAIRAHVLVTNRTRVRATPRKRDSVSRMMQYPGRRYLPYINDTCGSTGGPGKTRAAFQESPAP